MATKSDPHLAELIEELRRTAREQNAPVWREVARRLGGPLRNRPEVNIGRVARYAQAGETVLVPGKLLGAGSLATPVTVAAWSASTQARKKVTAAGGKVLTILELASANPKGSGVRILA